MKWLLKFKKVIEFFRKKTGFKIIEFYKKTNC